MAADRRIVLLIVFGFIACSPPPDAEGLLRFHDPAIQLPECATPTTISAVDLAKAAHVRIDKSGRYSWAITPSGPEAKPAWNEPSDLTTIQERLRQFEAIQDVVIWADETTEADPIARLVHATARHPTNIARHQFAVQAPPPGPLLIQTLELPVPKDPYAGTTGPTCFLFERVDIVVARASTASPANRSREDSGWDPNQVTLRVNGETLRWAPFLNLLRAIRKQVPGPTDPAEIDGLKASLEMRPPTTHADLIAMIHEVQATGINDITLYANVDDVDVPIR